MKRFLTFLLAIFVATAAQADFITDANVEACRRQLPDFDNGDNLCRILENLDDNMSLYSAGADTVGVTADLTGPFSDCLIAPNVAANLGDCIEELTTTNASEGANIIGYQDGGSLTLKANVDAALDQIYGNVNRIFIAAHDFRECDADGDVGNAAANGGILASDTTPIMLGLGTTDLQTISYATTVVDAVCASVLLPPNVDGTAAVTVNLIVAKDNAAADVPAWTVLTNWIAVGSAPTTDISDTSAAPSDDGNVQSLATTVAAADVPDAPIGVSLNLVPGAHANDILYLFGVEIVYTSE